MFNYRADKVSINLKHNIRMTVCMFQVAKEKKKRLATFLTTEFHFKSFAKVAQRRRRSSGKSSRYDPASVTRG